VLTDEQRHRLAVVLVRARNPNNIGAVARAMHNFGFTDLRLVNDYSLSLDKARSAVDASSILTSAREFLRVEDAVADCNLVVGTTAIGERKQEHPLRTLAEGAPHLLSTLETSHVALLFGSEKTGLSNEAMSHCHWLMTIPMHPASGQRHASMNLGQAAADGAGRRPGARHHPARRAVDPYRIRTPPRRSCGSPCAAAYDPAPEPESVRCAPVARHPSSNVMEN